MAGLQDQIALNTLEAALSSENGIQVLVTCADESMVSKTLRAKQTLYRLAKTDTRFVNIRVYLHPDDPDNRIWLFKSDAPRAYKDNGEDAAAAPISRPIPIDLTDDTFEDPY